MNVVLAAEESAGLQMLRALAQRKDRVVAVLTTPPQPNSTRASLWNAACDLGFETLPAELVKDSTLAKRLRSEGVDIFLNVHSLHVIHKEVVMAPKLGTFNLHPGPLPRYAGLNAVSWAIFRGEQDYGVTVHRIDAKIDSGPIAYQTWFPLEAQDTALSLSLKCAREGITLMLRLLEVAATRPESIPAIPQDLALRQYFGREVPEQGRISWEWPASKVINFVRACDYFPFPSPWGHPRARLGVQEFALVKAHGTGLGCDVSPGTVGASTDSGVYVACRDEWILASKLHFEGKYLPARAILRSGDRLAEIPSC
jgi:methionyl-tRNA formyltransferase